jgi:hypothetical protein
MTALMRSRLGLCLAGAVSALLLGGLSGTVAVDAAAAPSHTVAGSWDQSSSAPDSDASSRRAHTDGVIWT